MHCTRNTFLSYEHEYTCIACGYNVIKRKNDLSKNTQKKIKIINRLKYAEKKIRCICIDAYKTYEGDDTEKLTMFNKI